MLKRLAVAALLATLMPWQASALENEDLLALVAMPLAVAAVSEITDVPTSDLIDVVTLLNDAAVPPAQFVEVVRYMPVALVVENDEPDFVEFVRLREQQGLRGTQLVTSIEERIHFLGLPDVQLDVTGPQMLELENENDFIPAVVRTRVAEMKSHPHGGPPGQLKKAAGVQTGAEIVHRNRVRRDNDEVDHRRVSRRNIRVDDDDRGDNDRDKKVRVAKPRDVDDRPGRGHGGANAGKGNRGPGGGGGDHGGGKGKGKGKG